MSPVAAWVSSGRISAGSSSGSGSTGVYEGV